MGFNLIFATPFLPLDIERVLRPSYLILDSTLVNLLSLNCGLSNKPILSCLYLAKYSTVSSEALVVKEAGICLS